MEMPPLPRRKTIRLQNYDYFQSGAYFVTICTAHRSAILGNIIPPTSHSVGAGLGPAPTAIPELVRQLKSFSSRKINRISNVPKRAIWQRGYYEHILRNQQDFDKAAGYIAENPARRLEREEFE